MVAHLQVSASFHSYHLPNSVGLLSSIVEVSAGQYLVADPGNVYRLARDTAGYTITRLTRPAVSAWNPVGLAYRDGVVYVANGNGRDVVTARMDGNVLTFLGRFTNAGMRDPRNVVAEPDGSIEVADESGGAVLRFRADRTLEWRAALAGAHGLARAGGRLFATSEADHAVHEIDSNGKLIRSAGTLGVSRGRFLLPDGLTATAGGILVTDAHNGTITDMGGDLKVRNRVGGNGQGLDAFNYPSTTLPVADGYLIVDTFKYRVVHTDRRWTETDQVAFGQMVPVGRGRQLVVGTDPHPYTYPTLPGVDLVAALGLRSPQTFVGGLNGLDHVDGRGAVSHLDVNDPEFGSTSMTWADMIGAYVVIGSDQRGALEVVDPSSGMFTFVDVGPDAWWRSGALLLSENLRRDLNQVIAPAVAAFQRAKLLLSQGVSKQDAFTQALAAGKHRNLSEEITSEPGKQFLRSRMTADDARRYYDATLSLPQVKVVELLEVKYLSSS